MMLSPTNNPVPFLFCCIRLDACTLYVRVRNGVLLLRVTVFTFPHVDVCSPAITLKLLKIQILLNGSFLTAEGRPNVCTSVHVRSSW